MTNYFDKLKQKVNRRLSDSHVPDSKSSATPRIRSNSLSLLPQSSRSTSQTKYLIHQETANIINKKLIHILSDLGLQHPIPIRFCTSSSVSKSCKLFVANTNDTIFLPPASSTSFTYDDVDGSNLLPLELPEGHRDSHDELDPPENLSRSPSASRSHSDNSLQRSDSIASYASSSSSPHPDSANSSSLHRPLQKVSSSCTDHSPSPAPLRGDTLNKKIGKFHCPNYLSTKIDGEVAIPHTFAVIIELTKDTVVKDVNFEFISQTSILWPMGDPYNRTHHKEKFRIGKLQWSTTLSDYDYYINTTNSNDIKTKTPLDSETLAKRTKEYTLVDIHDEQKRSSQTFDDSVSFEQGTPASGQAPPIKETRYKAGLYVFLLPVLFPAHMPATISSINGSLIHNLTVTLNKVSEKLNRRVKVNGNYSLPMVRTPPSFANSIADKPVYVNRVWNDSLHYFITFPRKYVSLGSEHVINIKLIPLVKDVIIKRIKFNILEKITYVSKDLTKEYEYDSEDPFHLKPLSANGKARERVISLCELKTKQKSSNSFFEPFKEEVIKCPDNNLLFTCYEREDQGSSDYIATPLDINIALPFLTTRSDQTLLTANGNEVPTNHIKSRKASIVEDSPNTAIIGTLETNLVHTDHNREDMVVPNVSTYNVEEHATHVPSESMQKGITSITRALYPDSNYRHIQIHHRLQVCFRISKPDPNDNYKVHHYEVVVDTPLILLSAKCNKSSLELPKYDEIESVFPTVSENTNKVTFRTPVYEKNGVSIKPMVDTSDVLPTFEEAVQGPKVRSMSVSDDPLDAVDDFQPLVPPSYEEDCEIYTHLPLIDDMFDSTSDVPSVPGEPRLKNELSSAFAPESRSSSEENIPESIDELSSEEDAIDPAQIDSEDTIATSSESNINSSIRSKPATSISSTSDLINEEFIMDNVDLIEEEDTKSSQMTGDDIKLDSSRSEDDLSLNTGASSYCEQRLPLLQHCSTDTVTKMNRRPTTLSIQSDISIPVTLNMNSSGNR